MTMNRRASPPSSSLEIISNLTHRVSKLSESLDTCTTNSSRLATSLREEERRVEVCRENEKGLEARIAVVEEMLDTCRRDEPGLKQQLDETQGELNVCIDDREELKRQMESGVFVQFLDMVGKMGTGG
jgi:chromosome segregation ATPase